MALNQIDLTHIALDITSGISTQDRFTRLLDKVRQTLHCDAAALLAFRGQQFTPLAIDGLSEDVLGRRFIISEHPRLEAIARAGDIVRFPAESDLADPYDGLIPNQGDELKVHACIGLPLFADQKLIGALTIDAFDPERFDNFSNDELRSFSAIAAASLNNALLIDKLEKAALQSQSSIDDTPTQDVNTRVELIGQSQSMLHLNREIEVVANSELNALILGETGTGKELVASLIHQGSPRAKHALVYLNCAALPESVAESELFGHVKGAFTGAISHREGKFEKADGGTLFLDEIGELPLTLQSKLLRVLQYGDLQKVGDDRSRKVDVRIIAATNKDLKAEVLAGSFRADLYHRLSVFPLVVPPLRERESDITLLAGFFVERCRQKLGLETLSLSQSCLKKLNQHPWPGNVRELEHAIHRAAVLARASSGNQACLIKTEHFDLSGEHQTLTTNKPQDSKTALSGSQIKATSRIVTDLSLREAIDEFQTDYIRQSLESHDGNWAATARALQLDSGNLHRLAKRLGLK
ncbi:nitric oxide reductase transcriptional regulator NorR [Shewanella gelidii]|uniref:Anaerobic nitric oxide reductase transcription regulator NorR n=1 Tax=Shewanella gelidii TaxID=1642821 RepID=A0A917N8V2_9GAMM|nr:nitric oxide reductase transcriptional regulator NorR [Shewanella gelidii]MCL1097037.1 nitric oxide reductase transcriptional regulator NorR [Shewanella gelidii]GGI72067.1 anaerobic nitric oxide reductase transcription regulator NorR [Shewanella gelidii]